MVSCGPGKWTLLTESKQLPVPCPLTVYYYAQTQFMFLKKSHVCPSQLFYDGDEMDIPSGNLTYIAMENGLL